MSNFPTNRPPRCMEQSSTVFIILTPNTRSWIGSIQYSLVFVPGIFVGRLFDRGYFRLPFMLANGALILATFLVAECTAFWQVILCQGILTGITCGIMFSPLLALVSHWFVKRRQFAFGLVAVGSSIGGAVVPILVRSLLPAVGYVRFIWPLLLWHGRH
jgi:MFS family permease